MICLFRILAQVIPEHLSEATFVLAVIETIKITCRATEIANLLGRTIEATNVPIVFVVQGRQDLAASFVVDLIVESAA